jgi:hypothetical protein
MPLTINEFDEETIQLCEDLLEWLPGVMPQEIGLYGRALPEEFWSQRVLFQPIFINAVIEYRNSGLRRYLKTNAYLIMNQLDIFEFIRALAQYNPESVIANYRQEFPLLLASTGPEPISAWAKKMLVLWNNVFYFLSYKKYVDYTVYLRSILKLQLDGVQYSEARRETSILLDQVSSNVFDNNFSSLVLPAQLSHDLNAYFGALTFFPKEYYEKLIMNQDGMPLFALLTSLEYVFGALASIAKIKPSDLSDEGMVTQILWDVLATDSEQEVMLDEDRKRMDKEISEENKELQDDAPQKLAQLLTIKNIEGGYAAQYLHSYTGLLGPEQKEEFVKRLSLFLKETPLIQALFDKVDIEFFLAQLGPDGKGRNKTDFINGLVEFVDPALWPVSQKLMIMLASTI